MPQTIRQTLLGKLQGSQTLADLRADFEAMAGIRVRLVGPTQQGGEVSVACSDNALCARVRELDRGRAHCRRFTEEIVAETRTERLACMQCDAGLTGFCMPLKMGGETLGYLLAGGYRVGAIDLAARNRLRHLLARLGVKEEAAALAEFTDETGTMDKAKHGALQRWLQLAADGLIRSLELREDAAERPLPTFVKKICSVIQRDYQHPPTLPEAARLCGLSEGYFSRAFHEHTGLRFIEYIHAVRIEHVCELIQHDTNITDAAFAAGFQSISQFNRVFRKLKGKSPRTWRHEHAIHKASFDMQPERLAQ